MTNRAGPVPGRITSDFRLFVPFAKVDEEKREVWGWATVEVPDKQGEIIGFDASVKAFADWVGNIREMHDPTKAVGKAIQWIADTEKRGVYLGARISKGAEDTWQKVLDGTLIGFSIGGKVLNREYKAWTDGKTYPWVTEYMLTETSTVDNPACPPALFEVVNKADGAREPLDMQALDDGELRRVDEYADPSRVDTHGNPDAQEADADHDGEEDEHEMKDGKKVFKALDFRLHKADGQLSAEEISSQVCRLIEENPGAYGLTRTDEYSYCWCQATFDDHVICTWEGQLYWVDYTVNGTDVAISGNASRVVYAKEGETGIGKSDAGDCPDCGKPKAECTCEAEKNNDEHQEPDGDEAAKSVKVTKGASMHSAIKTLMGACGCSKCTKAAGDLDDEEDGEDTTKTVAPETEEDPSNASAGNKPQEGNVESNPSGERGPDASQKDPTEETPDGPTATQSQTAADAQKGTGGGFDLTKVDFAPALAKAVESLGLAKASDVQQVQEQVTKATQSIAGLEGRMKALESAPAQGGPVLRAPGSGPVEKGGPGQAPAPDEKAQRLAALEKSWNETSDPAVRDALGREIARLVHPANRNG